MNVISSLCHRTLMSLCLCVVLAQSVLAGNRTFQAPTPQAPLTPQAPSVASLLTRQEALKEAKYAGRAEHAAGEGTVPGTRQAPCPCSPACTCGCNEGLPCRCDSAGATSRNSTPAAGAFTAPGVYQTPGVIYSATSYPRPTVAQPWFGQSYGYAVPAVTHTPSYTPAFTARFVGGSSGGGFRCGGGG